MKPHFDQIRKGIIGINKEISAIDGGKNRIVYADWTASGRCYGPIEQALQDQVMPLVANTHTETNSTGTAMTYAYHRAQTIIKHHVNASEDDVLISAGSGMTSLINKFQRILHLKSDLPVNGTDQPVVFITHMEHHSNHTSWLETIAQVEIINPTPEGLVDLAHFEELLEKYADRKLKIASVTACSNVTGIVTPYQEMAKMIHQRGGYCFVDFACSAPYVDMDMHPEEEGAHLDAIFFSPHKFLGGPGAAGVLVFNKKLYNRSVPDHPGGGTVEWTNPWGEHRYSADIEAREDGGTPAFLQTIKTAMCISLKEQMGVAAILEREHAMVNILWDRLAALPNLHILAPNQKDRLGIISFYIDDLHHNMGVRLLNDKFGIQCRGGCSCAGTYGHYLLGVDKAHSKQITDSIDRGDYSSKPGWIRISLHPTMRDEEITFIADSIVALAQHHKEWSRKYALNETYSAVTHAEKTLDKAIKAQLNYLFSQPLFKTDSSEHLVHHVSQEWADQVLAAY